METLETLDLLLSEVNLLENDEDGGYSVSFYKGIYCIYKFYCGEVAIETSNAEEVKKWIIAKKNSLNALPTL